MPLFVDDESVTENIYHDLQFTKKYDKLRALSEAISRQPLREVGPQGLLYVGQREIGGTTPDDSVISVIGSDDATTCHIAVLRHSGSGATCVAHFDGCNTKQGLDSMVELVKSLSNDKSDGRLEMHLVGGFEDDRKLSVDLSMELLKLLASMKDDIHLLTACITALNSEKKVDRLIYPFIYGLAVDVKTGEIFKAKFTDKGPDLSLRGARHFTGGRNMINIYNPHTQQLTLEPFSYEQLYNIDRWLQAPDHVIRKNLSTSPEQEPIDFVDSVRASLRQIRDHPDPLTTMFPGSQPRRYKKLDSGQWEKL